MSPRSDVIITCLLVAALIGCDEKTSTDTSTEDDLDAPEDAGEEVLDVEEEDTAGDPGEEEPACTGAYPRLLDVPITNDTVPSGYPVLMWTGDGYGVTWIDNRDGNEELYFARISPAGAKDGDDHRITSDAGSSSHSSPAWTGSEYGVAWVEDRDGNLEIYFARISASGSKVGTDIRVTDSARESRHPSLAWTGSEFGLVWQDGRDLDDEIYFARLSPGGGKLGSDVRITSSTGNSWYPSLAWASSVFGAAWSDERDGNSEIYFARIDAGGRIGSEVRITLDMDGSYFPSLAWAGSEFGVAWFDERDGNSEIYFARISEDGTKVGTDARVTTDDGDSFFPSLAWTGSEYGVAWHDDRDGNDEVYFALIGEDGAKLCPDIRVTDAAASSGYPTTAWSGSEFGVIWADERTWWPDIFFAIVAYCP